MTFTWTKKSVFFSSWQPKLISIVIFETFEDPWRAQVNLMIVKNEGLVFRSSMTPTLIYDDFKGSEIVDAQSVPRKLRFCYMEGFDDLNFWWEHGLENSYARCWHQVFQRFLCSIESTGPWTLRVPKTLFFDDEGFLWPHYPRTLMFDKIYGFKELDAQDARRNFLQNRQHIIVVTNGNNSTRR